MLTIKYFSFSSDKFKNLFKTSTSAIFLDEIYGSPAFKFMLDIILFKFNSLVYKKSSSELKISEYFFIIQSILL